ncbi:MAG: hypothetical protein HYS22_05600 [Deltaproteobacteria bacterium]|nr:hypothetical protein [Deltaproteobacteria bacterium]
MTPQPIAIIAALRDELKGFTGRVTPRHVVNQPPLTIVEGEFQRVPILLVRTGMGRGNTFKALSFLFERYAPSLLLSTGCAGATQPAITSGDLILATDVRVLNPDVEVVARSTQKWLNLAKEVAEAGKLPYHQGSLLTVDKIIAKPHEKAFLGTRAEVLALEMETAEVARWAVRKKLPFLAVRAIFDPVSQALPDFEQFLRPDLSISPIRAVQFLLQEPGKIFELVRFRKFANSAKTAISHFLELFLPRV